MKRAALLAALLASSLLGTACAQKGLYNWGPYESGVLDLYKSPDTEPQFAEQLKTMIDEARKKGVKTPPGVAAEYGFLNYKAGKPGEAVRYFDLERTHWPESAVLMTRLIERIEGRQAGESGGPDDPDENASSDAAPETGAEP